MHKAADLGENSLYCVFIAVKKKPSTLAFDL